MEDAARAIIRAPRLVLPVLALLFAVLLIWVPQLVVLGVVIAFVVIRRRAKAHRFDTYVAEMLKPGGE